MKKKAGNLFFSVLAIILACIFIYLTLKQTNLETLRSAAKEANYFWFLVSMVLSIFSYWFRAARWKLLLDPIGHPIKNRSAFWSISLGYFANLTIPRSGEIARATSLYKMEKVPVNKSIGTIVLERVIDVLFLLLFLALTLIYNYQTLLSFLSMGKKPSLDNLYIAGGILFIGILLFFLFHKKFNHFPVYQKLTFFFKGIWVGFKSILKLEKRGLFIIYSFAIWICYFFMTYVVLFAFDETSRFGVAEGFFLIVAGAVGMILPAVGGLGYPYVMSMAFGAMYMANGQTVEEGRTVGNYFGLMLYFAQIISILIFGFLSIYYIGKAKK